MKFLNNNVKTKLPTKYVISTKISQKIIAILFSLIILALLTTNILIKKNMIITIKSTSKETFKNIDLYLNLKLDNIKESIYNTKFTDNSSNTNSTNKKLIFQTTNKNNDKLNFTNNTYPNKHKEININKSPILSFMSGLEIFYSLSLLIILIVIISVLIIALLYQPAINLLSSLDIMGIFTKNKAENHLTDQIYISSEDESTNNF